MVKSIETFMNENIYRTGVGIYDHLKRAILHGNQELKSIRLDEAEIRSSWKAVPNGPTDGCHIYYRVTQVYNMEAAQETADLAIANAGI